MSENRSKWTIRLAQVCDIPVLIELRREAEHWLAQRGIDQWTGKWIEVADEKARRAVRQHRAYVVTTERDVAGTVTLGGPDEDLWRIWDGPALYLYKLIIARKYSGLGIGAMVLDWACDKAAGFGYPWLRLDAWPTNPKLLDYYRSQGFQDVRIESVPGRDTGALMQRPAAVTPTPELTEADSQTQACILPGR